jgi:hypothetical protein
MVLFLFSIGIVFKYESQCSWLLALGSWLFGFDFRLLALALAFILGGRAAIYGRVSLSFIVFDYKHFRLIAT